MKTTFGLDGVWAIAGHAARITAETAVAVAFRNVPNSTYFDLPSDH
jgi:hypothetical protein